MQARAAVDDGADLAVTVFGQPRLGRAPKLSHESPAVVPTGIGMWPASDTALLAPWDGEIMDESPDAVTFRGGRYELTLSGVQAAVSGSVRAGETLAVAPAQRWVQLGVRPVGTPVAPLYTTAELAPGWLALTRDPRPLLGLGATEARASAICCRAATRVSRKCRSTTTARRRRSNAGGAITCCRPRAGATSTWSTT